MAKILVIDDDSTVRCLVARILADASHEVIEADNGKKGIDQFAAHRPDIVITDLLMPEKDGIETIRELRRIAPSLRILAMSGGGAKNDMRFLGMARSLGADAILEKPFRADELLRTVRQWPAPDAHHEPQREAEPRAGADLYGKKFARPVTAEV